MQYFSSNYVFIKFGFLNLTTIIQVSSTKLQLKTITVFLLLNLFKYNIKHFYEKATHQ